MSMMRSIRRSKAKKDGTFVAQKPLREKGSRSFLSIIIGNQRMNKMLKAMKSKDEIATESK